MRHTAKGFGVITLVVLVALLAACGGGGGANSSSPATPVPTATATPTATTPTAIPTATPAPTPGSTATPTATPTPAVWPAVGKTKVDSTGQPLASTATSWSCVRDNASGLMWEVKNTTDVANLRYYTNGYTNYDSTTAAQYWSNTAFVNPTQIQIDASTNTVGFMNAVNAVGLCGAKDWRLPTSIELQGLLTVSATNTVYIDTVYFPDVDIISGAGRGRFWSSSSNTGLATAAWSVGFGNSSLNIYDSRSSYNAVRLVRTSR